MTDTAGSTFFHKSPCHAFLNSDHHKPLIAEQRNVLLTLHPGLAHFVWCALILREIELIPESGKMDYFGSTMLQTIQKVMWPFTLQGLFQNCNISLLPHILLSNNTDQIVKEYSSSLLFQNLFLIMCLFSFWACLPQLVMKCTSTHFLPWIQVNLQNIFWINKPEWLQLGHLYSAASVKRYMACKLCIYKGFP